MRRRRVAAFALALAVLPAATVVAGPVEPLVRAIATAKASAEPFSAFLGALAVLLVVWVASTAVAAHEGSVYARYMRRQREVGELRMLQDFARDRGVPIEHGRN